MQEIMVMLWAFVGAVAAQIQRNWIISQNMGKERKREA